MTEDESRNNTGIFRLKNHAGVVVKWKGKEIGRYDSIEAFVDSHLEGVEALELKLEGLLAEAYKDKL